MAVEIQELSVEQIEEIKSLFVSVFTKEPWNDDWSDETQLEAYIMDLIGNRNSLALGLYEDGQLTGLALGNIRHWYEGTQYNIDELCISTSEQRRGLGTLFFEQMESFLKQKGFCHIFLQTDRNVPAYQFYQKNGFYELEQNVALVKALK